MTEPESGDPPEASSGLERLMRLFGDVRHGESITVLLVLGTILLILVASQIIKTVREPLILATGGAAVKSYSSAGTGARC